MSPAVRRSPVARGLAFAFAVAIGAGACGSDASSRPAGALPARILPEEIGGLVAEPEPDAADAFKLAGRGSMVAKGSVWTLRRPDGEVQGALQVGVLLPRFDTEEIEVRRGVWSNIQSGRYRWFKAAGRWVGVQDLPELRLYLWFPPRGDLYEVLQVRPEVADPEALVTEIIEYQERAA